MIHLSYDESKNIILAVYDGPFDLESLEKYEKFIHETFATLKKGEKITTLSCLKFTKIPNSDFVKRLAHLTKTYENQTEVSITTGLGLFTRFLYHVYLKLSGNMEIHGVSEKDFSEICSDFDILTPSIYTELCKRKNIAV